MNKLLFSLCFLILFSHQAVNAQVTGIPLPSFGLQTVPASPLQWPATDVAGYYYIDPDHPLATNNVDTADSTDSAGNRFGYPDKPRTTIPSSFEAGAFTMLSGHYSTWPQRIHMEGTQSAPIWFVGDPDDPPVFSGRELIFTGQYAIFDNLRFRDNANFTLRNKDGYYFRHHAGIRNFDMVGTGAPAGFGSAIGISGKSSSERTSDIVISNCSISYYGSYTGPTENDFHGIKPGRNADNIWVLNNSVHHNGGDSIQIGDANIPDEDRVSHVYIGENDFYSNFENDVDIKEADHIILSSNTLHDSGISIVVHNNSSDVWFINNKIFNSNQGADVTSGSNINFVGNVFYNIHHSGGSSWDATSLYSNGAVTHFRGGVSASMVNNTFHDYDTGIQIASVTSLELNNNLFHERAVPDAYDINLGNSSLRSVVELDNSLFYNPALGTAVNWATGFGQDMSEVVSLGVCGQCIDETVSPLQNASNYRFSLRSTASAINAGVNSAVYNRFVSAYSIALDRDIMGNTRVLGAAIDIGAYEGIGISPPSPPTLLP